MLLPFLVLLIFTAVIGCGAQKDMAQDDGTVGSAVDEQPFDAPAEEPLGGTAEEPIGSTAETPYGDASYSVAPRAPLNMGLKQSLPAGSDREAGAGYATVRVFYATDRAQDSQALSSYAISGAHHVFFASLGMAAMLGLLAFVSLPRKRSVGGAFAAVGSLASFAFALAMLGSGTASIEKEGVGYTAERGLLTRGIAEVTVPDSHQRGNVERPSLLRFEFREDQQKHIVLTSVKELGQIDFYRRLSTTVAESPDADILVFIHGYNVSFESAIQRTAQLSVDLPFRGVPVCFSWPSQGKLLGYTIDENNVAWSTSHLKSFLLELAADSGAKSINVVAHSMGNRALTAALREISFEHPVEDTPMFDRVVLAAPDVDADYFRKDLAPRLLQTANSVTLYASSDDNALIASKKVHGYPRAGEGGTDLVVVPGIETIDVTGIDLSLLGHSYYGDSQHILGDLFELLHRRLPAIKRPTLIARPWGELQYWQLNMNWLAEKINPAIR